MRQISRREFLRLTALGLGAASLSEFLTACNRRTAAGQLAGITPSAAPTSTLPKPTASQAPTREEMEAKQSSPTATPPSIADLSVARGGDNPEILVRRAMAAIGGMERFVPKGSSVIVKPNICIPAPFTRGATTNPIVVGTLVKMAFEAGAGSVKVLDYPFGGPSLQSYEKSGIKATVEEAGGEMQAIVPYKWIKTEIPQGVAMKNISVYDDILKADVLINVPVAKNHGEALYTIGLKNLMGIVAERPNMHISLNQSIVDINTLIRPQLTVVDCVRIMLEGGPQGGSEDYLKKMDTVIASPDIVAADSYALSLFDVRPNQVPYIGIAEQTGLGRSDIQNIKVEEIAVG